ncbi:Protoheme IX farnesyltransferase [Rubripirellula tenax]|uniref:Protoheme IX farnesyltransferase n=1 Tax=Rubripirellula tenax TaxID=2528015 RepID=A0A5C6FF42_9BACT|nr:protoheme IX farnesyltransferase [Rubripirellula tenax]TWU59362.1 Protoheme IX farnesyltransferase [Rubripirellula tenax]
MTNASAIKPIRASASKEPTRVGQGSAEVLDRSQSNAKAKATPSVFRDYVELTKPRIVTMILVTTTATAIIGGGGLISMVDWLWLMLGTAAISGSAGAANQIWERVIDCNMTRTANRPLPASRVALFPAVAYTAALGIGGSAILWSMFGAIPAIAGIATWLIYVLVYTPMKTRTAWNTTVGAVAGALPVLIGYTAMGGSITGVSGWLLFGVLATWQYPHFMAIAWMYRHQYDAAGFKMTTTVEPTGRSAGWQSIVGSLALIACGVALCFIDGFSWFAIPAAIGVLIATVPMLKASIQFTKSPDDGRARKLLRSSLLVLPAVLLIVTLRVFW